MTIAIGDDGDTLCVWMRRMCLKLLVIKYVAVAVILIVAGC
jgi:hypothetical protein